MLQSSRWWGCATTPNPVLRPGLLRPSMLSTSKLNSLTTASAQSPKSNSEEVGTTTNNALNSKTFVTFNTADSTTNLTSEADPKSNKDEHFKVLSKPNDNKVTENDDSLSSKSSNKSKVVNDSLKIAIGVPDDDNDVDDKDKYKDGELSKTNKDICSSSLDKERCTEDEADVKKKVVGDEECNQNTSERPDPMQLLRMNGLERTNLFSVAKNPIPYVAQSDYVFGQNVHERVVSYERYELELQLFIIFYNNNEHIFVLFI